jgi:hypothetical protein
VVTEERELYPEEVAQLDEMLPEAWRRVGIDPIAAPAPGDTVEAVNELVRRLRSDGVDQAQVTDIAFTLGYLLGEQWRAEFGWEWRHVTYDDGFTGYGVVPADRRFAYFVMNDLYHLFTDPDDELNLLLLFNMVREGVLPADDARKYVSLG